jgi:hypothetical protein
MLPKTNPGRGEGEIDMLNKIIPPTVLGRNSAFHEPSHCPAALAAVTLRVTPRRRTQLGIRLPRLMAAVPQRFLGCVALLAVAEVCVSRASQRSTFCFFSAPGTAK